MIEIIRDSIFPEKVSITSKAVAHGKYSIGFQKLETCDHN